MRTFLRVLALLTLSCAWTAVHAQSNAAMTGTVTDATGAVVPGTTVALENPARGLHFTAVTNGEGTYRFPNVPPAPGYKATFSHDGFAGSTVEGFSLVVGITRTQDAHLAPAGASVSVDVAATNSVVTLNTTDASVGNNIDIQAVNDLPVQNRQSPVQLFILEPGVNILLGSVTGARTDQSSITVDGMDVNEIATGSFITLVGNLPVDATQEFRGTVAGLGSSLGTGSGGQFQLVTRSGTDRFHGNLNEYHRDNATVSNYWFNKITNPVTPTPKFIRNQFGGALGGPVLKDRLFFFTDFYNSRIIQSLATARTVPLDSYRNGLISYVKTGCPATTRQTSANAATCIGQLSPAQVQALDPASIGENTAIFNLINSRYPHANDLSGGDGVNTGFFRFTQGTTNILYSGVARLDYNLTARQRVFVQFHNSYNDSVQAQNRFPGDPLTRPFTDRSYGYVASHIWQIGNNKINQFYFGDTVQENSFPLSYNPNGTTYVNVFGPFTAPYDGGNIQRRRVPVPTVRDDFNWVHGAHTLGFGGSFKFIKTSNQLVNDYNFYTLGLGGVTTTLNPTLRPADINTTGTTNTSQFDNAFTLGLGRVGYVSSIYSYDAAGNPLPNGTGSTRRYRYYQTEVYAGDTWKVNPQLTLTYGLRYHYYSVPFDAAGGESIPSIGFDSYLAARLKQTQAADTTATGVPFISYNLGGKANNAPGFFQPNWHDLAPRVAVAYNPVWAPKTVFNASANVVYDRTVYNAINFIQNQSSYLFQSTVTTNYGQTDANAALATDPRVGSTLTSLPAPPAAPAIQHPFMPYISTAGNPVGLSGGYTNIAVDPNLKTPYSIALNAGMQQELPGRMIFKAGYVGRMGRRLLAQADASQLIDFVDPTSGQSLSQAFANLTTQLRNNPPASNLNVTPQPFFENQITRSVRGYPSKTAIVAYNQANLAKLGDITDILRFLAQNNLLGYNVGVASQFADNDYYTNKGSSAYNAMILTLQKNMSQGLKFDVNYTWSHSVDNVSIVANAVASGVGFVCDVLHPRACRGNSDFDTTHIVTSDVVYQLPFGQGRAFVQHAPWYLNELIGGWNVSAIPAWQSGQALTTATGAYLAGFANNEPAIYDGSRSDDVAVHLHKNAAGQLLLFRDQNAAFSHFRGPIGIEYGNRNILRGPSQFFLDAGLAKTFALLPENRLNLLFRADAFNVLNHPTFANPSSGSNMSLTSQSTFGVITSPTNPIGGYPYRTGQFSLRLEF